MAYTNSSLVGVTLLSPNHSGQRTHAIDTITIHCVVGQCSAKRIGEIFQPTSRQASSNYGIGYDGEIGLYVEEKNRSWCSSNAANDQRAITIEVASDTSEPYAVNDKAYTALIELVADICKRNGIKKLVWSTNKNERVNHLNGCNMTVHRDYANKSCPGTYLYERHSDIANKVNAKLGATTTTVPTTPTVTTTDIKAGDTVKILSSATYYNGKAIPTWVKNKKWIVKEVSGDRVVIDKSSDGKNSICSPVKAEYLEVVSQATESSQTAWTPSVGELVTYNGKVHYASSMSDTALSCKGGKAKITQIYAKGKHPYHLVRVSGSDSTVYGWVDKDTFTKV